jgi:ribosomal protein S18 acetylase RimI-like enzyme
MPEAHNQLSIRDLHTSDCAIISSAFTAQGWNKPIEQYWRYLLECQEDRRTVLVAEVAGEFAGYITILWESPYPPFREHKIPEISDFNVLIKFRRRGIGTTLMDEAERRIAQRSSLVGIGVGLTENYGAAQILYVKRGYIPDGKGISHNERFLKHGDQVTIDDDLILCFTKNFSAFPSI